MCRDRYLASVKVRSHPATHASCAMSTKIIKKLPNSESFVGIRLGIIKEDSKEDRLAGEVVNDSIHHNGPECERHMLLSQIGNISIC